MNRVTQTSKAEKLLSLHTNGRLLILPNIWDPLGARILEAKGYPAVATASAAVSASLGYEDGERINRSTLVEVLGRIARSVGVPVTADIESGYGDSLTELKETIRQVIASGVVGINLEDSIEEGGALRPVADQCERIAVARGVADDEGVHLVINARVDTFLSRVYSTPRDQMEEAVARAMAYSAAGADCIYPIGPGDAETVTELRRRIQAPINILAKSSAIALPVMQAIGVNRVSFGPFIFRSCAKKFADIADALKGHQGYECFGERMMTGAEIRPFLVHERESDLNKASFNKENQ